jgi:hypothetical protein
MSTQVPVSSTMASSIYSNILGGPQSDRLLGKTTIGLIRGKIEGRDVLDIGVGNGRNSEKYLGLSPKSYTLSDYQEATVNKSLQNKF